MICPLCDRNVRWIGDHIAGYHAALIGAEKPGLKCPLCPKQSPGVRVHLNSDAHTPEEISKALVLAAMGRSS